MPSINPNSKVANYSAAHAQQSNLSTMSQQRQLQHQHFLQQQQQQQQQQYQHQLQAQQQSNQQQQQHHQHHLPLNQQVSQSNMKASQTLTSTQQTKNFSKMQSKAISNEIALLNQNNNNVINNNECKTTKNQRLNGVNNNSYDEKPIAMSAEKNYVRRGNFYGPVFDVDHLATFTVGSKLGLLKAEDGMRKLRVMEKSQGIWTMECQVLIDDNYLVVYDKKHGQEVEMFPLYLISDPTSVVSDDKKDIYNNILLFTVLEDTKKKTSTPSEMHIFQCVTTHSAEIVDELYKAKESRRHNQPGAKNLNSSILTSNPNQIPSVNGISQSTPIMNTKLTANPNDMITTSQIDSEVQILNHCFDDIERFVTRLQSSTEHFKEADKQRQKHRTKPASKKTPNDASKAQMPPPQQFIDIFQKFKLSFLLLARLKAHIHDPNAPELVHFLFTPLSLILNATKEQPYRGLAKTVWVPMINKETKELLLNCLTSKEQDLWMSLGDAWTITKEEAKLQPHLYANIEFQTYSPIFYDGWSPSVDVLDNNNNDMSHLAFASAAQVQMQSQTNSLKQIAQPLPIQKFRFYTNTQPQLEEQFNGTSNNTNNMSNLPPSSANSVSKYNPNQSKQMDMRTNQANTLTSSNNTSNSKSNEKLITIRNYDEMKRWAIDLAYRGAKVYECIHDRSGNNDKELTVRAGELLEVLDDKRNWWRLRNFYGNIGHAPVTILRQFEFSTVNNSNGLTMNGHHHSSHHQANQVSDKVGYF